MYFAKINWATMVELIHTLFSQQNRKQNLHMRARG
uniref:Uncharacterized protein n=1 Tax=Arundo donax TaxID=35708 RepID=A0A0A9CAF6_ARUDO